MRVNNISTSTNFGGVYKLNANQPMKTFEQCLKRDYVIATWSAKCKNSETVQNKLVKFLLGDYHRDRKAACNIVLRFNDKEDELFELAMASIGQKSSKL